VAASGGAAEVALVRQCDQVTKIPDIHASSLSRLIGIVYQDNNNNPLD
jgi:hypothetical protein